MTSLAHRSNKRRYGAWLAAISPPCLALGLALTPAHADEEFYKGKTITIINSTGNGGGYYNLAMAIARHMPKFIPGEPSIIVKSMPGAGSVLATNFMYQSAPRDGTYIATVNDSIPLAQAMNSDGVRFDADKFNWLGSTGAYNAAAYAWRAAGVLSFADLQRRELILGGTAASSSVVIYPEVANNLLGARFKIVLGYKSTVDIDLAMERGEVQARSGSYVDLVAQHPQWLRDNRIAILFQIGFRRDAAMADAPLLTELATNDEQRRVLSLISAPIALGRPYLTPPGAPSERVALLRAAFAATLRDPDFLRDARRLKLDVEATSGEDIARIVHDTVTAPADVGQKAKSAMASQAP